jgi:hypothetical protein
MHQLYFKRIHHSPRARSAMILDPPVLLNEEVHVS